MASTDLNIATLQCHTLYELNFNQNKPYGDVVLSFLAKDPKSKQ